MPSHTPLPIDAVLPQLRATLAEHTRCLLVAQPGAGKTTRVPLALLDHVPKGSWLLLEPRRVAARLAATWMAEQLGEAPGETVGYRVRGDSRVGPRTRLEVLTQGILTRMLQDDPALEGVAGIIFDEFHERSLEADLGLALALDVQRGLREDLRLLVMSATLDVGALQAVLGADTPVVECEGRAWPVETYYRAPPPREAPERHQARVVREALAPLPTAAISAHGTDDTHFVGELECATENPGVYRVGGQEDGHVLVFLPGQREIRRLQALLEESLPSGIEIHPLHGQMPLERQQGVLRPPPGGKRRVILSTAIAESSLTVPGVRVVIDAGRERVPVYQPRSGLTRLETRQVNRASADQRRGRAGREAPGTCYRLWPQDAILVPHREPEIHQADLCALVFELARWGIRDPGELAWVSPPPAAALDAGRALLSTLGLLEPDDTLSPLGRACARWPTHPRIALLLESAVQSHGTPIRRSLLAGAPPGTASGDPARTPSGDGHPNHPNPRPPTNHLPLACWLAAWLEEATGGDDLDLETLLRRRPTRDGPGPQGRWWRAARQWATRARCGLEVTDLEPAAALLARAFRDRIAHNQGGGRFKLATGGQALLPESHPLARAELLVAVELDGDPSGARVYHAIALDRAVLETLFPEAAQWREEVRWDAEAGRLVGEEVKGLGALILERRPLRTLPAGAAPRALLGALRQRAALPWSDDDEQLLGRLRLLHRTLGDPWPAASDQALLDTLEQWLLPHLEGLTRLDQVERLPLGRLYLQSLDWRLQQQLDTLAPTHLQVPSGSKLRLDYSGDEPVLAVKLQEMFGQRETPRIADGRVPVLLHLLSPARRPVQVTRDLANFWASTYFDVRKDLKGRYPKHPWPDDPLQAPATARTNRRK